MCGLNADIVFLLDTSGSIRDKNINNITDNFQLLKDFVINMLDRIDVGPDTNRVASIEFSNFANIDFYLDAFQTRADIQQKINTTNYQGGETNTAAALRRMREEVFVAGRGDRPEVANVGIMITDGESNKNETDTIPQAALVHEASITMFVVGVTNAINEVELREIASDPDDSFFFNSTSLSFLDTLLTNLVDHLCRDDLNTNRGKRGQFSLLNSTPSCILSSMPTIAVQCRFLPAS